ncbi:hypothetical protein DPMN_193571 [Dreissena polymorpha]|uniref:Uncharacterized protein n=1 Tax=Dreissena polymorpha TaxID=45954 RepID=A0A9D4B5V4_DREPO|nr:hypothetical protein DPMN_193571 [Dreissena polymorpha]
MVADVMVLAWWRWLRTWRWLLCCDGGSGSIDSDCGGVSGGVGGCGGSNNGMVVVAAVAMYMLVVMV